VNNSTIPSAPDSPRQLAVSYLGLILAIPFPIMIIILWMTISAIKGQPQALGEGTMKAVLLYLVQFFVVPTLSVASIVIAFVVTSKSQALAKKIGYISLAVTGVGFVLMGLFLNYS
jgi:hypothetical protein